MKKGNKMARLIDMTGQKFGYLEVLQRDPNKEKTYWICKCHKCGKIISRRRDSIIRKGVTSCGCDTSEKSSIAHLKDETGKTYNYLTVIKRVDNLENRGEARWLCKCKCGNITEVSGTHLRNGTIQSCGCVRSEGRNGIDETPGTKYGKLTVIKRSCEKNDGSHRFWLCQCDCGRQTIVNGVYLRSGSAQHCGCENSAGETLIRDILTNNNIKFKAQYTFPDLTSNNQRLRFDFGILNENNELSYLIEYDGIQHYKTGCWYSTTEDLINSQKRDNLKNEYCIKHNIPLIRISYKDKDKINIKNLKIETTEFLLKGVVN